MPIAMEAFMTGVVAGFGIAIPVGAIAILILQTGIRQGFSSSFIAGAGAATADLFYASLAVIGGAALSGLVDRWDEPLRIVSAIVLIVIASVGLRTLRQNTEPVAIPPSQRRSLTGTYARFLALTIVNPATVVYFAAVIIGLGIASDLTPTEGILFVAGAFSASLTWQSLLAGLGSFAGKRLSHRIQAIAIATGNLVILALAMAILFR